jgi:hypothetical protein
MRGNVQLVALNLSDAFEDGSELINNVFRLIEIHLQSRMLLFVDYFLKLVAARVQFVVKVVGEIVEAAFGLDVL